MKKFEEEKKSPDGICKSDGFEGGDYYNKGGTAQIFKFTDGKNNYVGKLYDKKYTNNKKEAFIDPYREFLLEYNLSSFFSIQPKAIFIAKKEDGSQDYYLIMECFKNLSDFYTIHTPKRKSNESQKKQLIFDAYLNLLLITISFLQAVGTLHVQKIPILHHDIKPGNVLLKEFELKGENLNSVDIDPDKISHTLGHVYFSQLIDFGLTKETNSVTAGHGTPAYRTKALYLKETDLLSIAITIKLLLISFQGKKKYNKINTAIGILDMNKKDNYVYEIGGEKGFVTKFYFKDPSKLKGLDIIINMLANSYYNRRTIIFDVLNILTDRKQLAKIISGDLKGKDINQEELLDKYFKILELSNINIKYLDDFEKLAPKIYGENYKAFLFTLFHQKNNKFRPEAFKDYQEKIINLYKQKTTDQQLGLEIAKYHYDLNFFCFERFFEAFSKKFTNISNNDYSPIYSKLFKILTSLNFKDTRSLNHFTNALHLSLYSVNQETLYNFEISFGLDFKAKVGFLLLHANEKYTKEEAFSLLIQKAKYCNEERWPFFLPPSEDDNTNEADDENDVDFDSVEYGEAEIKLDIDIHISAYDLITNNFEKFLEIINFEPPNTNYKDDCIKEYELSISLHKLQKEDLNNLKNEYNNDAIFMLFIHYLYFFEIKNEKARLKSLSQEDPICKTSDDDPDPDSDDDPDSDSDSDIDETHEEEEKGCINQIPMPDMPQLPITDEELGDLEINPACHLDQPKNKEIFIWLILYRLGDLIDDVLSSDTREKLQNYIPVVKFLRSFGISIYEFHVFLTTLEDKFDQFKRIAHICNLNQVNYMASKLQFLELMSYFHESFFDKIVSNIQNGKVTNDDFLKFISLEKLGQKTKNDEEVDPSDIRTKINFPYIVYPFGRIEYKKNGLNLSDFDPTTKSKIAVCLVHSLNYLTNLPFTFQIHINKDNIYLDENNDLPFIIMNSLNEDNTTDYFNYESAINGLKQIFKLLMTQMKDNKFLNIIQNYKVITTNTEISMSFNAKLNKQRDIRLEHYLSFQYIFELFLDETLDFTFRGTDPAKYKQFLDSKIKNSFYTDDQFRKFAYELLGQSYLVKLHYIFTRLKPGSDLTIDRFVNEMNSITEKTTLLEFLTNREVLIDIAKLFERYFEEIPFNLVHRLNQISEPRYKKINNVPNTNIYFEYNREKLNDDKIIYIYHITNKCVSPMIYASNEYLYFDVPKTKLSDRIEEINNDWTSTRLSTLYCSLHSALYYLNKYCDQDKLLPKNMEFEDIYINERDEAIVPPFKVNDMRNFIKNFFSKIGSSLEDHINSSYICYSYASYFPIKNDQSNKLMRVFGLDYLTEFNEFYNSMDKGKDTKKDEDTIISEKFEEKCKNIDLNTIDDHIKDLSSDVNKLSPLFIHLLEKAMQSKDEAISNEAKRRLNIFKNIKEIKDYKKSKSGKVINVESGESDIDVVSYNGKDVAIKRIKSEYQCFAYLEKMKNMLYLLKIEDQEKISKCFANEIGFTSFGILMDLYKKDLRSYLKQRRSNNSLDGMELLKIVLNIINNMSYMHSINIVHNDIKFGNFLIDDQINVYLGDNLNIQKTTALSKVTIYTPGYHSDKLEYDKPESLIQQDIYAFEVSCYKLFNQTDQQKIPIFINYQCPLIEKIIEKKDKDKDQHTHLMDYYLSVLTTQEMYVLPEESTEDKNEMIRKFRAYLCENGYLTKDEQKFMASIKKLNTDEHFDECYQTFKKINKPGTDIISFLNLFAEKLCELPNSKLADNQNYEELLNIIKNTIEAQVKGKDFDKDINLDSDIDTLILELFYLNNFNNVEDESLKLKLKFRLLQYSKQNYDSENVKYIIKILDQNQDDLAGFFYNLILSREDDVEIRLNAINFYYYHNEKTCTSYLQKLILETYDILISNIDKKPIFENWIKCNENTNEFRSNLIFKLPNINIISLCFYTYSQNQIKYKKLTDVFDDEFYTKADELLSQNSSSNNRYITYLREAVKFRKDHGQKLTCIYKKYYLPE